MSASSSSSTGDAKRQRLESTPAQSTPPSPAVVIERVLELLSNRVAVSTDVGVANGPWPGALPTDLLGAQGSKRQSVACVCLLRFVELVQSLAAPNLQSASIAADATATCYISNRPLTGGPQQAEAGKRFTVCDNDTGTEVVVATFSVDVRYDALMRSLFAVATSEPLASGVDAVKREHIAYLCAAFRLAPRDQAALATGK